MEDGSGRPPRPAQLARTQTHTRGHAPGHLSFPLAVPPLLIAATLFLVASAALSIADWTYRSEKYYREAQHAAATKALAYIPRRPPHPR